MIRSVTIRRFKRFQEERFDFPGHVVIAGPNNCGKTTVLQAIAAWGLALNRWKELNDFRRHGGAYSKVPIARQAFHAVPLRAFDLLWNDRDYRGAIEIEVHSSRGWKVTMELIADSSEQTYVRPKRDAEPGAVKEAELRTVFVPAMTGLGTAEPVYQRPKLDQLLGQGKPGDVLRNLLVEANRSEKAWPALEELIRRLFGYQLLPPDDSGADIRSEYRPSEGAKSLDIASAGSGFQQVLMLLTFLHARPGSVLLIDEPDAHLHVILQDSIYGELRSVAARQDSQLIIASHSEVIIDSVDPLELCVLIHKPRILGSTVERTRLVESLGILTQTDIVQALAAPGILYVEDFTDINILREWAKVLAHPCIEVLTAKLFWKKGVWETRRGTSGIRSRDHYEALNLVREDLPGLEIVDGDARAAIGSTEITGKGLQRIRWKRYEIESYLFHPDALDRYVERKVGGGEASKIHREDLRKHLEENHPPGFLRNPLGDYVFLNNSKAREELIPPALTAAGLHGILYTSYHEIAAVMKPEEIHPEIREKLDAIQKAFRL
ncbi:MAG: AAA family ATPase [Planctomycetes bacterium]|nr:AAA family ATPase [Planctomycetota bacterium]